PVVEGTSVALLPLRWTGASAPNQITFMNSFRLAYTGSTVNFGSLLLFPGGLLLFGGLLLSLTGVRRRGDRGALASE
ncbi:MAG TPA: hypothetical protein PKI99_03505, partial [Terrimesophilobacter sp.]|nr:hypothetical protein [Terrimesophilobacter sp.]